MVIQRIYVQPAATDDVETASKTSNSPARSQRSATVDSYTGNLATAVDPQAAPAAASNSSAAANGSPVALKRTPSTSTSKTGSGAVSRLIAQHTGGSLATSEYTQGAGNSRPASPLEGIRAPSTMSVLKPSDFARRKASLFGAANSNIDWGLTINTTSLPPPSPHFFPQAAFQKSVDPPAKFHAELERRYANPPSPLDLKELPQKGDG
ncbi:hypothetical protein FRC01_003714, partial [Tulasnella sp. 417]